ncbi:MAG: hypothetical protein VCG02_15320 [Verrucomicrobiota bacterium]
MTKGHGKTRAASIPALILVTVVLLLACGLAQLNRPEHKIHRRLETLADLANKSSHESQVKTLQRMTEIIGYFTEDCHLDFGPMTPEIIDRSELRGLIGQLRMHAETVEVKIHGKTISLGPGKKSATVELMLEGTVDIHGERANEFREYRLSMKKEGQDWLIDRLDAVRSITTPDQL